MRIIRGKGDREKIVNLSFSLPSSFPSLSLSFSRLLSLSLSLCVCVCVCVLVGVCARVYLPSHGHPVCRA